MDALQFFQIACMEKLVYNYMMLKIKRQLLSIAVAMCLVLPAVFVFFYMPRAALAQPRIVFKKEAINFGKAVAGKEVQGIFVVSNKGDQPLEIDGLRPG